MSFIQYCSPALSGFRNFVKQNRTILTLNFITDYIMKKILLTISMAALAITACQNQTEDYSWVKKGIDTASQQLKWTAEEIKGTGMLPRSIRVGYDMDFLERQVLQSLVGLVEVEIGDPDIGQFGLHRLLDGRAAARDVALEAEEMDLGVEGGRLHEEAALAASDLEDEPSLIEGVGGVDGTRGEGRVGVDVGRRPALVAASHLERAAFPRASIAWA